MRVLANGRMASSAHAALLSVAVHIAAVNAAPINGTHRQLAVGGVQRQLASVGGVQREVTCPLSDVELSDGVASSTHLATPQPQPDLVNCTWYRRSTCCSAEDTLRLSHADPEIQLHSTSKACRDTLTMLQCAACSPEQEVVSARKPSLRQIRRAMINVSSNFDFPPCQLFLQEQIANFPVAVLRTCESFCDRLYTSCSDAVLMLAGGRAPDRVDALFSGGLQFCQAVGLRAIPQDDNAACFSAASASWRRGGGAAAALHGGFLTMVTLSLVASGSWRGSVWLQRPQRRPGVRR